MYLPMFVGSNPAPRIGTNSTLTFFLSQHLTAIYRPVNMSTSWQHIYCKNMQNKSYCIIFVIAVGIAVATPTQLLRNVKFYFFFSDDADQLT